MADDPRVKIWEDRIIRSKKIRKAALKEAKQYIDFYEGNQWGSKKTTLSEKPVINLLYAHVKLQVPILYFQNPRWYCRPSGPMAGIEQVVQNAQLAEYLLNYYTKENMGITLKRQIRLAILDAFFSFGTIKVGYVADFEANPNFGKNNVLGEDEQGNPIFEVDTETGNIITDTVEDIVVNEQFYARRISPTVMLFDTEAENYFEDGRYVIQEIVKPTEDIKSSPLYENTEDLEPSYSIKPGIDEVSSKPDDYSELIDDLKRNTIYEIYDLEHDKLLVTADGHTKFLRDEPMPDGIDRLPFEFLRFNEVPDRIYPMSDFKPGKSLQEEINMGRGMIMTHAKRYGRKYGYDDSTFGGNAEEEMEKFKDPEDGGMFKLIDAGRPPTVIQDATLDPAVYANFSQSLVDFREVMGSTENDRGVVERRKTATEAGFLARASGVRKEDRKTLVEDFAGGVGNKLLQSMQANLTAEHAVEILGPAGKVWQGISKEQIAGQFTTGVEVGSSTQHLPEHERAELVQALQMIAQFPPELVMTKFNFDGLLEKLHMYFPLLEKADLINSPEQQQKMQQWLTQMKQQQGQGQRQGQK
uniref:Putative head tail connector protein n=1 Tax=viral metagenome TaxID=1070528 RepID=A0A6M3KYW4_9ZZZZ